MSAPEECARCGHIARVRCHKCGRKDGMLGSLIGEDRYCHTFSRSRPTCYETETWLRVTVPEPPASAEGNGACA